MDRRSFIGLGALGGAVFVSGCAGLLEDEDEETAADETAEEFLAALEAGDSETMNEMMHEEAETVWTDEELIGETTGESSAVSTVDGDPTLGTLAEWSTLGESTLETILAEEDAIVLATDGEDGTLGLVLATENGEWRILDVSIRTGTFEDE